MEVPHHQMGGYSPRQKDPINGVQWFYQGREIHESTSASQWHSIAINGTDPLFSTILDRPIIYRVLKQLNLSRGMDGVSFSIASIFIHNQIDYAMVSLN